MTAANRERLSFFIRDEDAQDLVEYALLGAFIGIASILVWQNIVTAIGLRYTDYNTNVPQLWEPPDPAPAGP
jgi:Flp pilus assembly pilin Flp